MVDPKVKRLAFKVCFTNSKGCGVMITNHHLGDHKWHFRNEKHQLKGFVVSSSPSIIKPSFVGVLKRKAPTQKYQLGVVS